MFWQNLEIFWPEKSDFDLHKEFLTWKNAKKLADLGKEEEEEEIFQNLVAITKKTHIFLTLICCL